MKEVLFSPIIINKYEVKSMHEIEIEFKNKLTKSEYNGLKNKWFPSEQPITQINHYFETEDFQLKENRAALRIREKNRTFIATLKEDQGDYFLETHLPLSKNDYHAWIDGHILVKNDLFNRLKQLNIDIEQLSYKGYLTTHRLQTKRDKMIIALDHSEYNGQEDYEIELEAENEEEGKKYFRKFLLEHHINERPSKNKIERFFETL